MNSVRQPASPRVNSIRPITKADLNVLQENSNRTRIKRLRDSHHAIARLFAAGLNNVRVAELTGYNVQRISVLRNDPSVAELIVRYRGEVHEVWRDRMEAYQDLVITNSMVAERQIADTLEDSIENNDPLPIRELLAISRDGADRFGYSKKSTQVNINVDFAARLEEAIRRSGKTIDQPIRKIA